MLSRINVLIEVFKTGSLGRCSHRSLPFHLLLHLLHLLLFLLLLILILILILLLILQVKETEA